ncbi:30S ribosomal protein S4 [Candidatus Falkowbacteria bacterium RIFOXYB2_FULL_34_18]|uniref:Small ribosomal subunit protein uS4 n=1 Tax=Candidatus Falkowbacteria bacterium RIFOXYD2_FULL_34_120 TaxID=1798007 RepID=A0A1F5TMY0_9BACT|nr:MAG: 30S ribosomal protein S4 [Candidatus Falkowbacteria bacterium RIFOXYC12_FULL_34_55]OGF28697.1 MAG: 30S ribosomal protein S4 [Candidatus Falkowbacteria bacterium RIFOXYB2_FULL_34_18]OGF38062.1 MAG: 30S ribosomal protein S4 [Candidatus Falkowbacteria bacterium RIFOXYC2_FULL_34_220]OGF38316.1 MAG: 30S ribosomal protein S4 [Candidatus Falkowbacteria bacterium RIFOXYD12_FULL_34_57]OGF40303.1 MAG: 30S ribosomal protein S4 [Candidatus Falkowbacteria bacterium RIFOXYD2_FULL_34_120]
MAKDLSPKCKLCRRAGEKLILKGERCKTTKCAMVKRNYPPGFHGPKNRKRLSDYGMQLNEKQKAKRQYNMLEKQFKLTFDKAKKSSGNLGENFLQLLETRFDNVVYRLGIASSRPQARQMIGHGLFTINGKKVNIPSYIVKTGDIVEIKNNKKNAKIFSNLAERLKKQEIPGWLNFDFSKLAAKVLMQPEMKSFKPNFNVQIIVEYYSR